MLNEPPENTRRPHPLEVKRQEPPPISPDQQQATLHIPAVSARLTWVLIVVNVLIFIIGFMMPEVHRRFIIEGANQQFSVLREGEYHRLLTAMFLHGGLAHIIFNMYALYIIGSRVEQLFGHARFALIYFLGGLAGSILSVLFNSPYGFSVGASGAVFAIFGAEMVFLYQHRKLLGASGRRAFQNLLWIAGLNFAIGIFSAVSTQGGGIDNWGHAGGLLGGFTLAWFIAPNFILKRHPVNENAFVAEDINPLKNRYPVISLYIAALMGILIVAQWI